jgi:DNA-binding MarR family transcriptional regulator
MKRGLFSEETFELSRLLSITRDAIRKARQKELDQYNVHTRRATLLLAVQSLGDRATPVAIGKWLLRERHSVSELLSKMENDGLVKKIRDLDRRNRVRVVLTPKGLRLYEKSSKGTVFPGVISSLSQKERKHLKGCLRILMNEALKELGK